MKLSFPGTRGEIETRTPRHARHTVLRVGYRGREVTIDCGADWRDHLDELSPRALLLTHSHHDHAAGLRGGAPCPVWAIAETWAALGRVPIADRRVVRPREPFTTGGIVFEAFPVEHSVDHPTVGYRITAGRVTVFYAPDLIYIHDREAALGGVRAYIGDGATLDQSFVRRRGDRLIGHAPVKTQLGWCVKEEVPWMIVSHCGKQIVEAEDEAAAKLAAWSAERGVQVDLAYDGLELVLR